MAGTSTPIFPQTVKNFGAQFLNADSTNKKTLVSGGANGTKIEAINVASTDTSARDLQLWLNNGSVDMLLGTASIPINSGNSNAAPAVDLLRSALIPGLPFDANGNRVLYVASGWTLKANVATAVTSAKEIDVVVTAGGDF